MKQDRNADAPTNPTQRESRKLTRFMRWYYRDDNSCKISTHYLARQAKVLFRSLLAWLVAKPEIQPITPASDVLFIYPSEKSTKFNRHLAFLSELEKRVSLNKYIYIKAMRILRQRVLVRVSAPLTHYLTASYAQYVLQRYAHCKLIVTEEYNPVFQYYLMKNKKSDQKIIHLAHSKITDDSKKFSINLCDYYFLLGESSIQDLRNKKVLFGSSTGCVTGAFFTHNHPVKLEDSCESKKIILIGMGYTLEEKPEFYRNYTLLDDYFSNTSYEVILRPHQQSDTASSAFKHIKVADRSASLQEACQGAYAAISIYSNAIMDVSYLGIPMIYFNATGLSDEWAAEETFGICKNDMQLEQALLHLKNNYMAEAKKAADFGVLHFGEEGMGSSYAAQCIQDILTGNLPDQKKHPLTERLNYDYCSGTNIL